MIELYIGIYLLGVLISSISQVLLKKAALHTYDSPLKEYLNPLVITAYAIFKEKIGKKKACALALIIIGIVIYSLGTA